MSEHKSEAYKGFTQKYNVKMSVYYESTNDVSVALTREKQMKKWNRKWKLKLIEQDNPTWEDLYYELT